MVLTLEKIKSLIPSKQIKREVETPFKKHALDSKDVTLLYGARQTGKSTLVLQTAKEMIKENRNVFYYNLDRSVFKFTDPEEMINYIKSFGHEDNVLIIDESQRLKEIGLFVKYIHDTNKDIKIILTGSASLEIKSKVKESLIGRKKEFYLSPLTLKEFTNYKGYKNVNVYFSELEEVMNEYLIYGGYPEVVLLDDVEEKKDKLLEIAETYLIKDVNVLFNIDDEPGILMIISFLAEHIGNLFNIEKVSKFTAINRRVIEKITHALKKSFVIHDAKPFHTDATRELIHMPKVYFLDLGIRNAVLNRLDKGVISSESGKLFENLLYLILQERYGNKNLKIWRTKNDTEVDFVASSSYMKLDIYEAKYKYFSDKEPRSMQSFREKYDKNVNSSFVITPQNIWEHII